MTPTNERKQVFCKIRMNNVSQTPPRQFRWHLTFAVQHVEKILCNDKVIEDETEIANGFNKVFVSVFPHDDGATPLSCFCRCTTVSHPDRIRSQTGFIKYTHSGFQNISSLPSINLFAKALYRGTGAWLRLIP